MKTYSKRLWKKWQRRIDRYERLTDGRGKTWAVKHVPAFEMAKMLEKHGIS